MRVTAPQQAVLDRVRWAVIELDSEGLVRFVNRRGLEILGGSQEDIVGSAFLDRFVPDPPRSDIAERFRRTMQSGSIALEPHYCAVVDGGGKERTLFWQHLLLRSDGGRAAGMLCLGSEFGEDAEDGASIGRSLKELEDIRYALDQSTIVAITDRKGIIRHVNRKFCEISKYTEQELLGQDHRIVNSGYHPKEFFRELWRTIARGKIWRGEIRNRAKDGTIYWVDTTIVPFLDARGRPFQYLAIRSDVTDRKLAELKLVEQASLAQVGQMAAVVAHEVKNPLAGIGGAVEIIGSRLPEGSPDREVIRSILERISSLNDKVSELLAYSRPRPPGVSLLSLRTLLEQCGDLLCNAPVNADVVVRLEGPDRTVRGDAEQLRSVFQNLMINAADAMHHEGEILVEIVPEDGGCRVDVADRGEGIPPRDVSRVFEPFFTTKTRGTGLGLAIARRVVEAHGGSIRAAAREGGGTTIEVRLPAPTVS